MNEKRSERPILFSGPMVRAILDGSKTQTRRPLKPQPIVGLVYHLVSGHRWGLSPDDYESPYIWCPYGVPDDRLWVRETFAYYYAGPKLGQVYYRADGELSEREKQRDCIEARWRPSIHMPRWASRLTLEVVSVKVERINGITLVDCMAEGVPVKERDTLIRARPQYANIWDAMYAKTDYAWEHNPWVWVVEFRRINGQQG